MEPGRRADELVAGPDDAVAGPGRRRWLGAAGLVLVAAAALLSRPDLALHADRRPVPAPAASPAPSGRLDAVAWDTRGDLAQDGSFVSAAVARVRQERPDLARVFFAGRLPDGGRLVLAGSDVLRGIVATAVHALVLGPGAPVSSAPVTELVPLTDPQQVLAWAGRGADGRVTLVALSRPGPATFDVSTGVRFLPDGSPRRTWVRARSADGTFVADLGRDVDPVVAVRATGPGVFPEAELVRVTGADGRPPQAPLTVAGTRSPGYRGPDPVLLARGLRQGVGAVADLGVSRLQVLWSGAPWKQRRLALVLVTRPDGLRLQALVGQQGRTGFPAGVRALPSGAPARLPWLLEPFSSDEPTYLLCPTGAGTLLYDRAGSPVSRLTVDRSGAVVLGRPGPGAPGAGGAEVTLLAPDGRPVLTTRLPEPGFDDPLTLTTWR